MNIQFPSDKDIPLHKNMITFLQMTGSILMFSSTLCVPALNTVVIEVITVGWRVTLNLAIGYAARIQYSWLKSALSSARSPCPTPHHRPGRGGGAAPASATPPGWAEEEGQRTGGRPPGGWAGCSSGCWWPPARPTESGAGWPAASHLHHPLPARCPPVTKSIFFTFLKIFDLFLPHA